MARTIHELIEPADVAAAWPVMRQLRPHLDEAAFLAAVEAQRAEGYRLAGVFSRDRVCAVAGFRVVSMLARGRHLYVDDLVTDEAQRGGGAGAALFEWLVHEARRERCERLHLDSGVQRFGAHRFYFARGMHIAAYHFALAIEPEDE